MIVCYINGETAYPTLSSDIKVTKENPYVKKGDSYTMDVAFSMAQGDNARIFGYLQRKDVSKSKRQLYDDCMLYADNMLIIRGSGRVTEVTETTVKLQIIGGYTNVRYRADFLKVFIDRIDTYPAVDEKYNHNHLEYDRIPESEMVWIRDEIRAKGYVGDKYRYVFMPTYDVDSDIIVNFTALTIRGNDYGYTSLNNIAVQPNLMMVLKCVLQYMGYSIKENTYDTAPWNELIIANARQTVNIAYALPHWSVDKFLDEFRKLFNASFIFDDNNKEVSIKRNNEIDTSQDVTYEVVEEYKTNFDEDGIEYLGGSNIKYDLRGGDRTMDDIPPEVLQMFEVLEYPTYTVLLTAFQDMSEKDKFTHVFHCNMGYFFYGHKYDDNDEDTGEFILKRFGTFGPLYRDVESDTFVTLKMCPANMVKKVYDTYYMANGTTDSFFKQTWRNLLTLPNVENPDGNSYIDYDEKGYLSVSNIIEDCESKETEETDDDNVIFLIWADEYAYNPPDSNSATYGIPTSEVDYRTGYQKKPYSLALTDAHPNEHYIGELHRGSIRIESTVDVNNEICYQFLMDGIPDPTRIYVFCNKRYICAKVEIKINESGIDRLKTGYFHEIKL